MTLNRMEPVPKRSIYMIEWTREERYQRLEALPEDQYLKLIEQTKQSPHRQLFHIQPPTGLLNDPNGFAYFNGQYHLFLSLIHI